MINAWSGCLSILKPVLFSLAAGGSTGPVETRGLFFFGIFVLATGLVSIVYPRFFWNIGVGRKAKIPPPRAYLAMLRFGGILASVLGAVMVLKSFQM